MGRSRGGHTADEILAELEQDAEWVAMRAAQEAKRQAIEAQAIDEQALLLADLRKIGYRIRWIWDFVNTADGYEDAIPILISHLRRPYSDGTLEGLARALSVSEARGLAGDAVVDVLKKENSSYQLRYAAAIALTVVADRSNHDAIKALLESETHPDVAERLKRALKTASKP
jgi:hypothetical protein